MFCAEIMPQCGIIRYYFYTCKQLYVISFLFFDTIDPEQHHYLLQAITLSDNALVCNRVYGYLKLCFISTCVSYVFNILPDIFPLYLLVTTQI